MSDFERALAVYREHSKAMPGEPFCHAPFLNLHFSHGGEVLACCHNRTHILGTYPAQSVDEIWTGEKAQQLRRAMVANDLSKGCQACMRQLMAADLAGLDDMAGSYWHKWFTKYWRDASAHGGHPERFARLPFTVEFELHNSCNLECVMCHGVASSTIRKRRDALPALPSPYDSAFVDQVARILPEVSTAGFTGGEPFLIPLYYEIWDRIAECNPKMFLMLVTNGTILNDRVRRLVERLNFVINVSMDSIVKETYESIRVGSSFDLVMENSLYFADVMHRRGMPFTWRCCAMRQNWRELPDMVRFCDDRGIRVVFNQVEFPLDFSLHTLPPSELQEIADYLRRADTFDAANPVQTFNRGQYRGLLQRIESFVGRDNWRNSFLDRLARSSANPMLNEVSVRGARLSSHVATDALAEKASAYVATRLTIDQAVSVAGADVVPREAWDSLSAQRRNVVGFRDQVPLDVFLQVFLNVCIRTYIKIMGVRADHSTQVYGRIMPLVHYIEQRADRDAVVDGICECPPGEIYMQVSRRKPHEIDILLERAFTTREAHT